MFSKYLRKSADCIQGKYGRQTGILKHKTSTDKTEQSNHDDSADE